jgi:hypothetical protein
MALLEPQAYAELAATAHTLRPERFDDQPAGVTAAA